MVKILASEKGHRDSVSWSMLKRLIRKIDFEKLKVRGFNFEKIYSSDVNIMNFISVASLFAIMVWLINDAHDSLIADLQLVLVSSKL